MSSNHLFPTIEVSEIVSLNALDLTVEALEQRLELSYAWIGAQPDDGCNCHCSPNNCQNHCGGCLGHCPDNCMRCDLNCTADHACGSNTCSGGNCPVEPGDL
ncbi:MAG: hypothetical protein AAGF95_20825 [Chloroflexota bacterium]